MNAIVALAPLIFSLVQKLVELSPKIGEEFKKIFSKAAPTTADWEAAKVNIKALVVNVDPADLDATK